MQASQCSAVVLFPRCQAKAVYNPLLQQNVCPEVPMPFPYKLRGTQRPRGEIMVNLMTEHEVSKRLNVSVASLRRWRLLRRGPTFLKVGSLVRYQPEDLEAWLASLPTGGAARDERLPSGQSIRQGDSHK